MPAQLFNIYLIFIHEIDEIAINIKTGDGIQGGVSPRRKKYVPNVY